MFAFAKYSGFGCIPGWNCMPCVNGPSLKFAISGSNCVVELVYEIVICITKFVDTDKIDDHKMLLLLVGFLCLFSLLTISIINFFFFTLDYIDNVLIFNKIRIFNIIKNYTIVCAEVIDLVTYSKKIFTRKIK